MITDVRPLMEINQQAIRLLYKDLGVVDAVRFLKQFSEGYGNYTLERDVSMGSKSLDELIADIQKMKKPGK
jgi:hypothetical protein